MQPARAREYSLDQNAMLDRTGIRYLLPITLLAICTPVLFSIGGLVLSPFRVVLLVTILPLLAMLLVGRFGRFSAVDGLVLAYTVWQVVAVGVNNPDRVVEFSGSNAIEFLGGYLIGRATVRNPQEFETFVKILLVILLVLLVPALVETRTGRPMIPDILGRLGVPTIRDVPSAPRLGLQRAQTVFTHPIHFGLFASSMLALAVIGLANQFSVFKRAMAAALVCISTVFSVSSGALLPLMVQIIMIAWALGVSKVRRRWLILAGLGFVVFIAIELFSDRPALIAVLTRISFSAHNVYMRTLIFEYGVQNILANPIFGLGLGDWVRPYFMYSGSVDNFWILNGMRYGIPGVATLALAVAVSMIRVARRDFAPSSTEAQIKLAWMLAMVSLVLTLFTVHVWGGVYTYLMIMLASGHFLMTWSAPEEEKEGAAASPAAAPRRGTATTRFPVPEAPAAAPPPLRDVPPAALRPRTVPDKAVAPERQGPAYTRFARR